MQKIHRGGSLRRQISVFPRLRRGLLVASTPSHTRKARFTVAKYGRSGDPGFRTLVTGGILMKRLILVSLLLLLSLIPSPCRAGPIVSNALEIIALELIAQISASAEAISQIPASAATSVVTINVLLSSLPEATDHSLFGSAMSSSQVNVSGNSHARAQGFAM